MIWSGRQLRCAAMGDEPTDRDARKVVQRRQHRIQNLPADILEVNIDAVRTVRFQTFSQLGLAMVDAGIESEFVLNEAAFLFAPGNADGPAAFDLGDLADQRTDGARSRSDDDALSGLRFSNVQQTSIRAEARHAEHTECVGNRAEQAIDLSRPSTVGQRVILPSGCS